MPIHPVRDISEYKRMRDALRDRFENERTGDQTLLFENTKLLQPLINSHQETVKAINKNSVSDALVPLTTELNRRNEQVDLLAQQPYYYQPAIDDAPMYSPSEPTLTIDLDGPLNDTDKDNLQKMGFDLPSVVFENKSVSLALDHIKTANKSIGQKLGKRIASLKEDEIKKFNSQKVTLVAYKEILKGLQGAKQFESTPKKRGKGLKNKIVDAIYYHKINDLCTKLAELHAAKQAGNTGLVNNINSVLDELLRVKAIDKNEYDDLYSQIFA